MVRGVLDRIEDGLAVVLIEEEQKQFTIPVSELPPNSKEGTWFTLKKDCDEYSIVEIDEQTTEQMTEKSMDLLAQLRAKKKGSKFKRN